MGLTRGLCALGLSPHREVEAQWAGLAIPFFAIVAGHAGYLWAWPLAGAAGPFFPVTMARVSRAFPEKTRALTITLLTSVQLALALAQLAMGRLTDAVGITNAYWTPALVYAAVAAGLWRWRRWEKLRARAAPLASAA